METRRGLDGQDGASQAGAASGVYVPPWQESERLAALRAYNILDSRSTQEFRDFVLIATDVCETPAAVVNLVDETRQWFAAECGLGVREAPLGLSLCVHAMRQPGVLVVPDLRQDIRFADNPLVATEPHLRFYAGARLVSPDGLPLGTICVLDFEPRPRGLTERQRFILQALARQVMTQLELRRSVALHRSAEAAKDLLLAERDLLTQEVDHRVKNSLAMVQGLLLIQARGATPQAARQLQESASRVHTIAAMHDLLYRTGTASHINVADYLALLLTDQRDAAQGTYPTRTITYSADAVAWPAAQVPMLGLIAIELVTNALKYGSGDVSLSYRQDGGTGELVVDDEGGRLPDGFDPARAEGLGLRLIGSFLRARDGGLTAMAGTGRTRFTARMAVPG